MIKTNQYIPSPARQELSEIFTASNSYYWSPLLSVNDRKENIFMRHKATGKGQGEHCCEPGIPVSRLAREPWKTAFHEYLDQVRNVSERY